MKLIWILILGTFFLGPTATATTAPSWRIEPRVCVASTLSDACEMIINVTLEGLPPGNYCLFQDDIELGCWQANVKISDQKLRYNHRTMISLRNQNGTALLEQQLVVKARQSNNVRRRIRQPWSLF